MASDSGMTGLLAMINGYQQTCIIVAALELGMFDRLGRGGISIQALAADVGADPGLLGRLVRSLVVLGLVDCRDGEVALTRTGRLLRQRGATAAIAGWAKLVGSEYLSAWGALADNVRTGEVAFERAFGMTVWQHRDASPELNQMFNQVTSAEQLRTIAALLAAYDFRACRHIVDVGGGHGHLVAGILKRHAEATGIVFDLPQVVAGAPSALAEAGVADRCQIAAGSFLDEVPAGGDLYLLKHVLHNWDDATSAVILRHCRAALGDSGRLLVLETIVPEDPREDAAAVMLDIHMMVVHGGRERTVPEFSALFAAAGLRLERCIETPPGIPTILEVVAATVRAG